MSDTSNQARYPDVMATFASRQDAEAALQYLDADAIPRDRITIRTAEVTQEPPHAPHEMDGRVQEDEQRNLRTMTSSLAASGAGMAAAGVVIATGGAALPAVAAAAVAGLGAGAVTEGVATAASPDVRPDEEKAAAVLVVSPANVDQAERAKSVLNKVSAIRVWEE
jgi:hypothetical protein